MEVELFDQIRCNKFLSTKVITHLVCAKMWPRHSTQGPNWFNRTIYTGSFDNSQYLCRLDTMYFQAVLTAINKRITWSSMALNRTRWRKTWPWLVELKKLLVFWRNLFQEPDFCRDILETRIKMLLREHLKISRDISFFKVDMSCHPPVAEISFSRRRFFQSYSQLASCFDKDLN